MLLNLKQFLKVGVVFRVIFVLFFNNHTMNLVVIFSFVGIDISSSEMLKITLISYLFSTREINTQEEFRVLTSVFTTNIGYV